ncbi:hypothetical protein L484_006995 [Morus notabilis]|uniref:Uncharacterized protein n=1 Tax=Morus notabilis TaxID=981085 RepID=W9SEH8_9ROSA|nr:hypothetical protein L484_006995 [Morus notabilis]
MESEDSEPKRRKIKQPPRRIITPAGKEEKVDKSVPVAQIGNINLRIQQAKNFAIAQAQQDGCTGNFKIFDSPFGNYFVPVIPSRNDLTA